MRSELMMETSCVWPPLFAWSELRDRDAPEGMQDRNEPSRLQQPSAINSCEGLILGFVARLHLVAKVFATE